MPIKFWASHKILINITLISYILILFAGFGLFCDYTSDALSYRTLIPYDGKHVITDILFKIVTQIVKILGF